MNYFTATNEFISAIRKKKNGKALTYPILKISLSTANVRQFLPYLTMVHQVKTVRLLFRSPIRPKLEKNNQAVEATRDHCSFGSSMYAQGDGITVQVYCFSLE